MGTALAFFLFYEGSYLFFAYANLKNMKAECRCKIMSRW